MKLAITKRTGACPEFYLKEAQIGKRLGSRVESKHRLELR